MRVALGMDALSLQEPDFCPPPPNRIKPACNPYGGCQNDGPFLGTLNNRCRIILGTQKGSLIFTTTLMKL